MLCDSSRVCSFSGTKEAGRCTPSGPRACLAEGKLTILGLPCLVLGCPLQTAVTHTLLCPGG